MKKQLRSFFRFPYDPALLFGLIALVVALGIWISLYFSNLFLRDGIWANLFVEFGGAIFDILIFGVLLAAVTFCSRRKQDIARQCETIEDYKRWDSEEARFCLAGAIRRLNRKGVMAVNLSGIQLSNFSFSDNGIGNLARSTLYDGTWGQPLAESAVKLNKVKFDYVDCQSIQFSPFNPLGGLGNATQSFARFLDCSFFNADLRNAIFNGALLAWTAPPPDTHFEHIDDEENGAPIIVQKSYGPFDGANLTGASFADVIFENADFRGAENILDANFSGAKGLDNAEFDGNDIKQAILSKTNKKLEEKRP